MPVTANLVAVCCTTAEIGRMALKYKYLADKGVKVAALSCNALGEHQAWLDDVVAHCENKVTVDFPIIAGKGESFLELSKALKPVNSGS